MRTKRFVVQMVMMAALAVATAGVMPAKGGGSCGSGCNYGQSMSVSNIGTYADNLFDVAWIWFESVVLPIL
jgi:hypothetical protein